MQLKTKSGTTLEITRFEERNDFKNAVSYVADFVNVTDVQNIATTLTDEELSQITIVRDGGDIDSIPALTLQSSDISWEEDSHRCSVYFTKS